MVRQELIWEVRRSKTQGTLTFSKSPNRTVWSRFSGKKYLYTLPTGDDLAGAAGARGGVCGPEKPESGDVDIVEVRRYYLVFATICHTPFDDKNG
jgi:hypothetical protein